MSSETKPITRPQRRYLRIGLRGLMLLVLLLGGTFGWVARRVNVQRDAVAAIKSGGGAVVMYDRHYARMNSGSSSGAWLEWVVDHAGIDYFGNVVHVEMPKSASDAKLERVGQLPELVFLSADRSPVTEKGLAHLSGLRKLQVLSLVDTPVSDQGLASLERLHSLQSLWLAGSGVTDAGMAQRQENAPARGPFPGPHGDY